SNSRGYYRWATASAVAAMLFFGLALGQDFNWDQQNAHISVAHLLLRGAYWRSIAPTGYFLNPALYVAEYWLITTLPALLAAAVIALVQSSAFVIAAMICLRLTREIAAPLRYQVAFLGFLLSLASPL